MRQFHSLMAQANRPEGLPQTVGGLIARWLAEHPGYQRDVAHLRAFAGDMDVDDVGSAFLEEFLAYLKRARFTHPDAKRPRPRPLSPRTIRGRVIVAAAVLKPAVRAGQIVAPAMPALPRSMRRPRDLSPDVLAKAFATLPPRAAAVFRFILATGCRPGEACRLEWSHVRLEEAVAILPEHKTAGTGRPRSIRLTGPALEVLEGLPHREGVVFRNRLGNPYTSQSLRCVSRARGFTPYQLRHTFAQMASGELKEQDLAALLGHASTAITRHYYDVRDDRAAAAARSLGASLAKLLPPAPSRKSSA